MKKRFLAMLALASGMLFSSVPARAVVLTFEGVGDQGYVGNYYNGGPGGDYGISFMHAYTATEQGSGGSAPYATEPSPITSMSFYNIDTGKWNTGSLNVEGGFFSELSFYYSSPMNTATVTVYDDLNGLGNVLASIIITPQLSSPYSSFDQVTLGFSGTAYSVVFSGVDSTLPVVYDNISLSPVPEPTSALLFGVGTLALGLYGKRRKMV
ncbi:MAG: PEP-CTERM sorting domain-containing protein [Chlorobiaceae bacterium]|nr:PEP-CTERM sorting domain-containing protein [Chlorobiaceae bacterium]